MSIRIVVFTNDMGLEIIFSELESHPMCEELLFVKNHAQIGRVLRPNFPNLLMLDSESERFPDAVLSDLKRRFNLYVIIIGGASNVNYMQFGFVDMVKKPIMDNNFSVNIFKRGIITKLESFLKDGKTSWHQPNQIKPLTAVQNNAGFKNSANTPFQKPSGLYSPNQPVDARQKIIAITASTGGTDAIFEVLRQLPYNIAPIVVVQHMPAGFTKQFADRLDKSCQITVKEAEDGDYLRKGLALVAPGDFHMRLIKKNDMLAVECVQTPHVHAVRPAADVLFQSIPPVMGGNVLGVVLTGMGSDGARGLFEMKARGAKIIGQDEASCVVYGMPKAAFDIGAVDYQLPLSKVADMIMKLV